MVENLKIILSGTIRPMTLKVGMQNQVLEHYQVPSNDDRGLTLTYFTARSNLVPYAFVWEKDSLVFVEGNSDSTFSNFFSLETTRPVEAKFYVKPPWDEGMKVNTNGLYHMTKMAVMSAYGRNLKNHLFWSNNASDIEAWYTVLVTQVLSQLFK